MKGYGMNFFRGKGLLCLACWWTAAFVCGAEKKLAGPKGHTDPKGVSLELRLVAKQAKYKLDLGGKSSKEFTKQLAEAKKTGRYPEPPGVDLTLELRNTGTKDLQIHVQGDQNSIGLVLKGPGAVSVG